MDFRDAGIDARFIYSGTPAKEREKILNDFKSFKFPVLMNCGGYYPYRSIHLLNIPKLFSLRAQIYPTLIAFFYVDLQGLEIYSAR